MSIKSAVVGGLLLLLAGLLLGLFAASEPHPPTAHHSEDDDHGDDHGHADEHGHGGEETATHITPGAAAAAGIATAIAGPGRIADQLRLYGTVRLNEDQVYEVSARFGGMVQAVAVEVGDRVQAGEVLAVVENTDSLQRYEVSAPASGVVLARHASAGAAADQPLFTLADLSTVWVDFSAFPKDRKRLAGGQQVDILGLDGQPRVRDELSLIAPVGDQVNQAILARAVVANGVGEWVPGTMVSGLVTVSIRQVPLAVQTDAIQTLDGFPVVFARHHDRYEARRLTLGAGDSEFVEVLEGLSPGTEYVTANSYLIKADLLKAGAAHAH